MALKRVKLGFATAITPEQLWAVAAGMPLDEPTPRETPNYAASIRQMQAEAEAWANQNNRPDTPPKLPSLPSGKTINEWLKKNQMAVYMGAAALLLLAVLKRK